MGVAAACVRVWTGRAWAYLRAATPALAAGRTARDSIVGLWSGDVEGDDGCDGDGLLAGLQLQCVSTLVPTLARQASRPLRFLLVLSFGSFPTLGHVIYKAWKPSILPCHLISCQLNLSSPRLLPFSLLHCSSRHLLSACRIFHFPFLYPPLFHFRASASPSARTFLAPLARVFGASNRLCYRRFALGSRSSPAPLFASHPPTPLLANLGLSFQSCRTRRTISL